MRCWSFSSIQQVVDSIEQIPRERQNCEKRQLELRRSSASAAFIVMMGTGVEEKWAWLATMRDCAYCWLTVGVWLQSCWFCFWNKKVLSGMRHSCLQPCLRTGSHSGGVWYESLEQQRTVWPFQMRFLLKSFIFCPSNTASRHIHSNRKETWCWGIAQDSDTLPYLA